MVFSFLFKNCTLYPRDAIFIARAVCAVARRLSSKSLLLRYRVQMIKGMIESFSPHNSAIIVNVILSVIHSKIPILRYL